MTLEQQFVLPIKCKGCSFNFDLKHDLLEKGIESRDEVNEALESYVEHFCWECRDIISGDSEASENEIGLEEIEGVELNLSLDYIY